MLVSKQADAKISIKTEIPRTVQTVLKNNKVGSMVREPTFPRQTLSDKAVIF